MLRDSINDDGIIENVANDFWNLTFSFISSFLALFRMLFALQEQIIFVFSTSPKTTRSHDCRLLILLQSSKVTKGQGWLVMMMINVIQNAVCISGYEMSEEKQMALISLLLRQVMGYRCKGRLLVSGRLWFFVALGISNNKKITSLPWRATDGS